MASNNSVNVQITADASQFITNLKQAESALNSATNNMKNALSSLNTTASSLVGTLGAVTTQARAFSGATAGSAGSTATTNAMLAQLSSTLTLVAQRLANNTSALQNTGIAMGNLTTATRSATLATNDLTAALIHAGSGAGGAGAGVNSFGATIMNLVKSFGALYLAQKSLDIFKKSETAVIDAEQSFKGFESAVNATGNSMDKLNPIIEKYAKNTALTRSEIMASMSSMMKMKFTPEQMDKALGSATDLAVFGRQKGKKYGQSIVEGFEGLRMGLSNNTNNMGWQENIAKAEEKYAASIGKTTEQLTQQEKAQAYVISMSKEGAYAAGDAAKAQDTLAGAIDAANKQTQIAQEEIGQMLTPAYKAFHEAVANTWSFIAVTFKTIAYYGSMCAESFESMGTTLAAVLTADLRGLGAQLDYVAEKGRLARERIIDGKGYQNTVKDNGNRVNESKEVTPKEKWEEAKKAYDLMIAKADEEKKAKLAAYDKDLAELKIQLDKKIIAVSEYTEKVKKITQDAGAETQSFLDKQISGLKNLLSIGYKPKDNQTEIALAKAVGEKEVQKTKTEKELIQISGRRTSGGGRGDSASAIAKAEYDYAKALRDNELDELKSVNQTKMTLSAYAFQQFKTDAKSYYQELNKYATEEYQKKKANLEADRDGLLVEAKTTKNKTEAIRIKKELATITRDLSLSENEYYNRLIQNETALDTYNKTLQKNKELRAMDSSRNDALAEVSIGQIKAETGRALNPRSTDSVTSAQGQVDVENAKFEIQQKYLQQKKAYLLQNEKENADAIADIDQQLTDLKREHLIQTAQLQKDLTIAQKQEYLDIMGTYKTGLATFIADNVKQTKSLKDTFQDFANSIHNKLIEIASNKLMEKIFDVDAVKKFADAFASNATGSATGSGIIGSIGSGLGSLMSGGGNILSSLGSSLMSFLPSFDVGTNYVPKDTLAMVHKGEKIVPEKYNREKDVGKSTAHNYSVNNNFILQSAPDKRTQQQIASTVGSTVRLAGMRRT